MSILTKRPFEPAPRDTSLLCNKRVCRDSSTQTVRHRDDDDTVEVDGHGYVDDDDGADESEYDNDHVIAQALVIAAAPGLAHLLGVQMAQALSDHVKSALYDLLDDPTGIESLCAAITSANRPCSDDVSAILYRAARWDLHDTVDVLVVHLCVEDEIDTALAKAVAKDNPDALSLILDSCARNLDASLGAYSRLARDALDRAVEELDGREAIVERLAAICTHDDILLALDACCGSRTQAWGFKALWKHAGLCAHQYIEDMLSGRAYEYLWAKIQRHRPCHGDCILESSDKEDADDDSGDDDGTSDDESVDDAQ
ncbi:hypothetical protein pmac_cds_304 [Pandoravirus macleodensis]|uniref:Uncharacterized protein n=1 Tax=Pandoravirus macleodensis TaxID=2107707 RepID=A0A2U7UF14_9VIRU|nr:hypothetical protein pmac_cds_304 [Pandoravirus macleodensis]AVK76992.1 hypothetical protein pmac_cds_304 [Pandoravirus macleodensis]